MKIKSLTNNTGPDVNLELELNELESFTLKVINKLRMWGDGACVLCFNILHPL